MCSEMPPWTPTVARLLRRLCLAVFLTLVFNAASSGPASAVELKIAKGARYQICREFTENLRSFPTLFKEPPIEVPIDPRFKDFRKITWEALDPKEHEDVLREVTIRNKDRLNRKTKEVQDAIWQEVKPDVLARAQKGDIGLGRTRMDLNHDGVAETVYRYGYNKWPSAYPEPRLVYAWTYHVLERDQPKASRDLRVHSGSPYDAFYHRGRVYLASPGFNFGFSVIEPTDVRIVGGLNMRHVCEIEVTK